MGAEKAARLVTAHGGVSGCAVGLSRWRWLHQPISPDEGGEVMGVTRGKIGVFFCQLFGFQPDAGQGRRDDDLIMRRPFPPERQQSGNQRGRLSFIGKNVTTRSRQYLDIIINADLSHVKKLYRAALPASKV